MLTPYRSQLVDELTCSLVKERLNIGSINHLARRAQPGPDVLSNILQACEKSNSERYRKQHDSPFGDGRGSDRDSAQGPIGNSQYPPYGNTAASATSTNSGNGGGSGSSFNPNTGTGSGSGSGSGSGASSNTGSSGGNSVNKVPFNPSNAPFTVSRRADTPPVNPPPVPQADSAPPPVRQTVGSTPTPNPTIGGDADVDGFAPRKASQKSTAAEDKPEHPSVGDKEKQSDSGSKSDCVGQAGSVTCAVQPLGL